MESVALGIAPCDSSVIVPERPAPTTCECAGIEANTKISNAMADMQRANEFPDLNGVLIFFIIFDLPSELSPPVQRRRKCCIPFSKYGRCPVCADAVFFKDTSTHEAVQ